MSFITLLMPLILKILDFWLDKVAKDKKMKEQFLDLVDSMGKKGLVSTKLRKSYYEKKRRLQSQETSEGL